VFIDVRLSSGVASRRPESSAAVLYMQLPSGEASNFSDSQDIVLI
jgi:hypothetical protein